MDSRSAAPAYDAYYYAHGCGTPYQRDDAWLAFFASVADRIVADIGPRSVLDVGCAFGFLVEALRARGVEAYGIDISPYAIGCVHPDVAPFCRVARATDSLDRDYDLVVSIEVLEHMPPREAAETVANICARTADVLFSSTPFDFAELTHVNVQPPPYWAALFARAGFVHDLDFDATFIAPWTMRLRRADADLPRVVATYERRIWQLDQERQARRELGIAMQGELAGKDQLVGSLRSHVERLESERDDLAARLQDRAQEIQVLAAQVRSWEHRWRILEASPAWAIVQRLQTLRVRALPAGGRREQAFLSTLWWNDLRRRTGAGGVARQVARAVARRTRAVGRSLGARTGLLDRHLAVPGITDRPPLEAHAAPVDVIVCVHDAPDDVRRCLESVVRHTRPPFHLILVDDASAPETAGILAAFARQHGATLRVNDAPRGYTRAANQALAVASGTYAVLLNSDTVVGPGWLDRLVACAESDERIGMVGPLSNTASWQSVPEVLAESGDWATNPLPDGLDVDTMADLVARRAGRLYPPMPLLNGFCLLMRRALIDAIGLFDEARFGEGYGEENDFALRARAAGWRLALADDVYVWHGQSRSYSTERRLELSARANAALLARHDRTLVEESVARCRTDPVLEGIRARAATLVERRALVADGRARFAGRRVLFVLPVRSAGGGANVVIGEARAMREMGADVQLFNLDRFRRDFEAAYPDLDVPVVWGDYDNVPGSLAACRDAFDAMVATVYASVGALHEVSRAPGGDRLVYGYYIQDFEPYFFEAGGDDFHRAWRSYTLIPSLVRFTKTEWNRRELETLVGLASHVVGPSFDVDLFRPRPRHTPAPPDGPVRVAAMIRPDTAYRAPRLTMELLQSAARRFGGGIEVVLFGCEIDDGAFRALPIDFPWRAAGLLGPRQMAALLPDVDVFVDFSSHQAMGLTALEAMACGVAVAVSGHGGATTFARHGENALVVDPTAPESCRQALEAIVEDGALRARLARRAIHDVARYHPEGPAWRILAALFGPDDGAGPVIPPPDPGGPGGATGPHGP
jgi:GT2 family glycosyltransferase/glycosyltransferase involved in cell wall biosynthesis/SAM-dependent methyltransferase